MKRRHFLGSVTAAAAVGGGCGRPKRLDHAGLGAVAHTILPSELGTEAHERIAEAFRAWADGIRPGAELNHGYGTAELEFVGDSAATRWQDQLETLDREARSHYGAGLAFINDQQRMQLIRDALAAHDTSRLPNPLTADHVALAILAYFYRSPEATDLAYGAAIRKQQCRPLADAPRPPLRLDPAP